MELRPRRMRGNTISMTSLSLALRKNGKVVRDLNPIRRIKGLMIKWINKNYTWFKITSLGLILVSNVFLFVRGVLGDDQLIAGNETVPSFFFIFGLFIICILVFLFDRSNKIDNRVVVISDDKSEKFFLEAKPNLVLQYISTEFPTIDNAKEEEVKEVAQANIIKNSKTSTRGTFGLWGGIIRLFLIWTILIIFLGLSSPGDLLDTISLPIIISLNIVLAYYGLKPEKILPTSLIYSDEIEKPTTKTFIKNFPLLHQFLNEFEEILDVQFTRLKANVNTLSEETQKYLDGIRKPIEVLRSGINNFKTPERFQSPFDTIAFIILAIILSYLSIIFPSNENDLAIQVITGSAFAGLAIIAGNLFQGTFFISFHGNAIKKFYTEVNELFNELELAIDGISGDVKKAKANAITKINSVQTNMKDKIDSFWKSNFLDKLPDDLSALFTLFFVSMILFIGILFLAWEPSYSLILWFISYYFVSKK